MRALFLAGLVALAVPASAAEYRTVTWYADHPDEMRGVLKLCRDHPGLAGKNSNCRNAEDAGVLVTQRELNKRGGNPYTPSYWQQRPIERRQQMFACAAIERQGLRMDSMTAGMCDAARKGN